jgi:uncharacterized protein YjbJ (UPF0337 family)
MNWDRIQDNWSQVRGRIKERWARLTDDEVDQIQGQWERLAGRLQEKYGVARDEAERQINDFSRTIE